MRKQKGLLTEPLLSKSVIFALIISLQMISCERDRFPYEDTFKKGIVESSKIEPIVEILTVDARLDSVVLLDYFKKELKEQMESDKAKAKIEYDKAKTKYDESLRHDGKRIADGVYLRYVTEAKENYDGLLSGVNDSVNYEFYYDRLKNPTIFEEVTVKFRLSKDGPLLVQRYRTDIFKGDTSFYELKGDDTIAEYIK